MQMDILPELEEVLYFRNHKNGNYQNKIDDKAPPTPIITVAIIGSTANKNKISGR